MKKRIYLILPILLAVFIVTVWSVNQRTKSSQLLYGDSYAIESGNSGSLVQSSNYAGFLANHSLPRVLLHPDMNPEDCYYHITITSPDKKPVEVWCYPNYVQIHNKYYAEEPDFLADVSELYRDMLFDQSGQGE